MPTEEARKITISFLEVGYFSASGRDENSADKDQGCAVPTCSEALTMAEDCVVALLSNGSARVFVIYYLNTA